MTAHLMVGRRPIFTADLEVTGYHIEFVDPPHEGISVPADRAALERAGGPFGFDALARDRELFITVDADILASGSLPLPSDRTVVEIPSHLVGDAATLDACRHLIDQGYRIACGPLDDLPSAAPLLELASFVKVQCAPPEVAAFGATISALEEHLIDLAQSPGNFTVIAQGVSARSQMKAPGRTSFDLFEGHLLSTPVTVVTEALNSNRITCMRLVEKLGDPESSTTELERIVETDAGLSYRLLHVSGLGSAGGLRRPVKSIREAVVLYGRQRLYAWLILMLVADARGGAPEQLTIAMTRARHAELLARTACPAQADSAFTVGMLSAMDLLLGLPMTEIVRRVAVTDDLVAALLERSGPLGAVLADVCAWETGSCRLSTGAPHEEVEASYIEALAWAGDLCATVADAPV